MRKRGPARWYVACENVKTGAYQYYCGSFSTRKTAKRWVTNRRFHIRKGHIELLRPLYIIRARFFVN